MAKVKASAVRPLPIRGHSTPGWVGSRSIGRFTGKSASSSVAALISSAYPNHSIGNITSSAFQASPLQNDASRLHKRASETPPG